MLVDSVVVEQLELTGLLKTFMFKDPDEDQDIVIALLDEYEDPRDGPFHFLNQEHELRFAQEFARCRSRSAAPSRYRVISENLYEYRTEWRGIPTRKTYLSYYALYLPVTAVPESADVQNPDTGSKMSCTAMKDSARQRYVIYLECRSSFGRFNFDLTTRFQVDPELFVRCPNQSLQGFDSPIGPASNLIEWRLGAANSDQVKRFLDPPRQGPLVLGDVYITEQAAAVGPSSRAEHVKFEQRWNENSTRIDLRKIASELNDLQSRMLEAEQSTDHHVSVEALAEAQKAASSGDGPMTLRWLSKAGLWALERAKKTGGDLVSAVMKDVLGL